MYRGGDALGQNLSRALVGQQGLEGLNLQESPTTTTTRTATQILRRTRSKRNRFQQDTRYDDAPGDRARDSQLQDSQAHSQKVADDLRSVADTIENDIVPRLLLARGAGRRVATKSMFARPGAIVLGAIDEAVVAAFAQTLLAADPQAPAGYIECLLAGHTSLEAIYLELLAPAARFLGEAWNDDRASFADVMLGLAKLQGLLREFGPRYRAPTVRDAHHRILLAATPGETHVFGITMVEEFFRRAGWDVTCMTAVSTNDLGRLVRQESFSVVGLSASCDALLEPLAGCIHRIRRDTRNRALGIMVGGRVFVDRPDYVSLVGADTVAADGRQAVRQARNMLTMLADRAYRA